MQTLLLLAASLGLAMPSLETLNETDLAHEVRPGGVNGSPFWNVHARQFIYAPSFDFTNFTGAVAYRFSVRDAEGRDHSFVATNATASLAPVWRDVVPGPAKAEAVALDANGRTVGFSGARAFWRSAPFRPGAYAPRVRGYRECAKRALEWMFAYSPVASWHTNVFDKTYQLNCFPSKMIPAVMDAAILLGELDPSRRASLLSDAENAARWMMANSVKAPASMRGLPITYCDYWEETKGLGDIWNSKRIAHDRRNQVMMIYPAHVGRVFIRFARSTGKAEYREYARTIADRYLGLQRPDGSWPFLLEIGTGRDLVKNAADATGICRFLGEISDATGDARYAAAAKRASERALPTLRARLRSFDWEGQFEDVGAQKHPYENLTKDIALATCGYLYAREPNAQTLADYREAVRFSEDQFVVWGTPRHANWYVPGVIEQYNCEVTIDGSYDVMIGAYLELWRSERNPLDRAKAYALGDAITRNQMPDGLIPTVFPYDPGRAGRNWLNCMLASVKALLELETAETPDVVATRQMPVSVARNGKGNVFADFGKDAVGWLEILAPTGRAFTVWLGEKVLGRAVDRKPGGTVRAASARDFAPTGDWTRVPLVADRRNTLGQEGIRPAQISPEFGVVMPFRYVELEGLAADADVSEIRFRRHVLAVPMDLNASSFASSDGTLDAVYDLCKYSIWATSFTGLYVDGDRERIPYEADAWVNQLGHYAVDSSLGMARDTMRSLARHPTWPTEWAQYLIMMVWADWMQSGETGFAEELYEVLKTQKLYPCEVDAEGFVSGNECDIMDWPVCERDGYEERPCASRDPNGIVNAFHYRNLLEMRDLAEALGRKDDAIRFAAEAKAFAVAFNRHFLSRETGLYTDYRESKHSSLHVNVAAVVCGLCPPERLSHVADFLERRGMVCSAFFAQHYLEALFKAGRTKTAVRLMAARGERSWYGMIEQGSTITMEAWNHKVKPNQDWNHAWATAPLNLVTRYVLGVRPTKPGFAEVEIAPQLGDLTEVEGRVPTPRGSILVRVAGGKLTYSAPPNVKVIVKEPDCVQDERTLSRTDDGTFCCPLSDAPAPDPFVTYDPATDFYYCLHTEGTCVRIRRARRPEQLLSAGEAKTIFKAFKADPSLKVYRHLWAPEMHRAPNGKWYVYTSADTTQSDEWTLRLVCLESETGDPFGGFRFKSFPLPDVQAIDPTVYWADDGRGYLAFAHLGGGGEKLAICELENPWTCRKAFVDLKEPTRPWEKMSGSILEGPFFVKGPDKNLFLTYSANDTRSEHYALGALQFGGTNLLDGASWRKRQEPILFSASGVYGPGHASFFRTRGGELWCAYHGMDAPDGKGPLASKPRRMYLQPADPDDDGCPHLAGAWGKGPHLVPDAPKEKLPPLPEGAFTYAVIPDTQRYGGDGAWRMSFPDWPTCNAAFESRVNWIATNAKRENIVFVSHVGDVSDCNNAPQYRFATNLLSRLDGIVPWRVCAGNHDLVEKTGDTTEFEKFFGNPNRVDLFEAGGIKFVLLTIVCNAPEPVMRWADEQLEKYADRKAIVCTHAYLGPVDPQDRYTYARRDGKKGGYEKRIPDERLGRMPWLSAFGKYGTSEGAGHSGETMWREHFSKHGNLFLIVCGDQSAVVSQHLVDRGAHGNVVHAFMQDYPRDNDRMDPVRLFRFVPSENKIEVFTVMAGEDVLCTRAKFLEEHHRWTISDVPLKN